MSLIGKNIRKIRAVKKLSQADFAALFNLARPSIGAYEEGRAEPKIETIIQIAHHFGISIDLLLTKEITINELYHLDKYATEKLRKDEERGKESLLPPVKHEGMPLVSADRLFDYLSSRENKDFLATLPILQLPIEPNKINRAFEINSNEMWHLQSGMKTGDIVNTIFLGKDSVKLKSGHVYVVISGQRFFIRRLNAIQKVLVFIADNPDFPETRISIDEINEIWEVKGIYSEQLDKINTIETKISDLEKSVIELNKRVEKLENNLLTSYKA